MFGSRFIGRIAAAAAMLVLVSVPGWTQDYTLVGDGYGSSIVCHFECDTHDAVASSFRGDLFRKTDQEDNVYWEMHLVVEQLDIDHTFTMGASLEQGFLVIRVDEADEIGWVIGGFQRNLLGAGREIDFDMVVDLKQMTGYAHIEGQTYTTGYPPEKTYSDHLGPLQLVVPD